MAKELDKVIKIGDDDYNVNAKKAERVERKLIVNQVGFGGTTLNSPLVEFDGSGETNKSFEIIPTTGGKFKGPIRVPAANVTHDGTDKGTSNIKSNGDFFDDAVLNYKDIKDKVLANLLNTSVLYKWNGTALDATIEKSINGITLITGTENNLNSNNGFAKYNFNSATPISAYLYICTDTGNIYFGTADQASATRLAEKATEFNLTTPILMGVDLESENTVDFDGTENVVLGVTGKLPLAHGGLGGDISNSSSQAAKTAEYYINGSIGESTATVTDDTWMLFRHNSPSLTAGQYCRKKASALWTYIAGKIRSVFGFNTSNVLSVANGGTGATTLNNITVGNASKATSDANGTNIRENYYRNASGARSSGETGRRITIDTRDPNSVSSGNHGAEGDIWIVYKN
jgi:hypothetical protein